MSEKKVPAGPGESEYVEKRSRFLGHIRHVSSEEEAKAFVASMKKQFYDARHNCWCYIIDGGAVRYSDDSEPQGTAGIPMLEVLKREGVSDVVCVVTRYFGGVLLGAGGLLRAYTKACKDALVDAGIEEIIPKTQGEINIPYNLFEQLKPVLSGNEAKITDTEYSDRITVKFVIPTRNFENLEREIIEASNGRVKVE